jgi:hypothetical protein
MTGMEWILESGLALLLVATLFHAVRLERALGVLKRDRAALEALVASFNASSRQAESGIEQLRATAEGAGRQLARQIDSVGRLKDDLLFLLERGERLADRLDGLVRTGRPLTAEPLRPVHAVEEEPADQPRVRSQAERDLIKALRLAR